MGGRTESKGEGAGARPAVWRGSEQSEEEGSEYVHLAMDCQAARQVRHLSISLSYGSV